MHRHSTPPPLTQYHTLITYPATVDPAGYMQSAMASWVRGDCLRSLGPAGSSPRPWHSLAPTVPVVRGEAGARLRSASLRLRWNHPARLPRGSPRQCVDSQNPAFLPVGGFGEWRPRHTRCTRAPCARECHGRRRAGGYHPPTPVPQVLTYFHVFGPRDSVPASQVAGSVDSAPASPPPPEVSGDGRRRGCGSRRRRLRSRSLSFRRRPQRNRRRQARQPVHPRQDRRRRPHPGRPGPFLEVPTRRRWVTAAAPRVRVAV